MVRHGPRRLRIFPGGWGETRYISLLEDVTAFDGHPPRIDITWSPTKHLADRTVTDGCFDAITDLPSAARTATVRRIAPSNGSDRLCLLMAAWNDHGYDTRQRLADELVQRGIGSLILEIPYGLLPIFQR